MTDGSMTKAELVEEVSRVSDLTKKHSEVIVDTVFKSIIDALHRGEKIELRGFGSFRLRKREPRKGRNPKTGDKVDVPPKKVPYFKPGKELKELINKEPRTLRARRRLADPARVAVDATGASSVDSDRGSPLVSLATGLRDRRRRRNERPAASSATPVPNPSRDDLVLVRGRALLRHPQPLSLQQRPPDGRAEPSRRHARRRRRPTSSAS